MTRRLVPLAVVVVAAVASAGCSLGNRQAMADRISRSADKAAASRSATGTISVTSRRVKTHTPQPPGPPRVPTATALGLPATIDFANGRATIGFPDVVFNRDVIYERRIPPSAAPTVQTSGSAVAAVLAARAGESSGGPTSNLLVFGAKDVPAQKNRRPWLKLDYRQLEKRDPTRTVGSFAIHPAFIVRLLKGTLTGSVRNLGAGHYTMNVSREKAQRGLSDKDKETLDKVFRANAIGGDAYKAEVWIGADGRPQRIQVRFRQTLSRVDRADLTVRLALTSFGDPVDLTVPAKSEVARVNNLGQLIHAVTGR